jgi:hypothetical protein
MTYDRIRETPPAQKLETKMGIRHPSGEASEEATLEGTKTLVLVTVTGVS